MIDVVDARRISVSSGRKELSVSSKILFRLSSCGRTSKANGVNQIAIVDILVALTLIGLSKSIYELIFEISKTNGFETKSESEEFVAGAQKIISLKKEDNPAVKDAVLYAFFGSIMFFQAIQLLLGFILLRGSIKRLERWCKIWLVGQTLLLFLEIGFFVIFATIIPHKIASWVCSILFLGSILYKIYCIYVVNSFNAEMAKKGFRKPSNCGPPLIPVITGKFENI